MVLPWQYAIIAPRVSPSFTSHSAQLRVSAVALQPGDIAVFGGGTYGHTGIVLGYYNNGYIALLGTNQGGVGCNGGGSSANIINISTKNFLGESNYIPSIQSNTSFRVPSSIDGLTRFCLSRNPALGSVEKSIGGLDKSVALMQKDIEYLKKEKI